MSLQNAHATYHLSILTHLDKVDPGNNTNSQPIMHWTTNNAKLLDNSNSTQTKTHQINVVYRIMQYCFNCKANLYQSFVFLAYGSILYHWDHALFEVVVLDEVKPRSGRHEQSRAQRNTALIHRDPPRSHRTRCNKVDVSKIALNQPYFSYVHNL